MRAAPTWEDWFAIAEDVLVGRYGTGQAVDPEITFTWKQLMTTRGQVRVERLANESDGAASGFGLAAS